MLHNRKVNTDLAEELEALGFSGGGKKLAHLANNRLDESIYGAGVIPAQVLGAPTSQEEPVEEQEAEGFDPIDGPYVTHELLDRLDALDLEEASDEDLDALIDGLEAKEINPALSEEEAEELQERMRKTVTSTGKIKKVRILTGTEKLKGKMSRRGPRKAKIKASRRKYARKGGKKLARIRNRFASRIAAKKKQIGAGVEHDRTSALAEELRSLLSESVIPATEYDDTLEKMCDVFDLIEWHLDDEAVSDVLDEAIFELWNPLLSEDVDEEEFTDRCKPVLSLMAHCLKKIEAEEGN